MCFEAISHTFEDVLRPTQVAGQQPKVYFSIDSWLIKCKCKTVIIMVLMIYKYWKSLFVSSVQSFDEI